MTMSSTRLSGVDIWIIINTDIWKKKKRIVLSSSVRWLNWWPLELYMIIYTVDLTRLKIFQIRIVSHIALLSLVLYWYLIFWFLIISNFIYNLLIWTFWRDKEKLHSASSLGGFKFRLLWSKSLQRPVSTRNLENARQSQ